MAVAFEEFAKGFAGIIEEDASELLRERELKSIPLWDSLAIVSFMALASDKFDCILDPEPIAAALTVEDLFMMLAAQQTTP